MSRRIDLTRELTEDERQYLLDRGWQHMLDENAMHLMGGGVSEEEVEVAVVETETETETVVETPPSGDEDSEQSEGAAPESAPEVAEEKPAPKGRGRK